MKSTGIVRTIDEVSRIIIPKEVRQRLFLRPGDQVEIVVENGCAKIYKYEPEKNLLNQLVRVAEDIDDALNDGSIGDDERELFAAARDLIQQARDRIGGDE